MIRTVRISEAQCIICKETRNVEMHHIKGVKYLKGTTVHTEMMRNLNRVQVPLCRTHHRMAHKNGLMNMINEKNRGRSNEQDQQSEA